MERRTRASVIAYLVVGAVSIGIGAVAAIIGYPASLGLTTAQALERLDYRPMLTTGCWVAYSLMMIGIAMLRARSVARNTPGVRFTAARGSIWLWGAIGAPWIYVSVAWSLPFENDAAANADGEGSVLWLIVLWWWFGALIALVVGFIWSSVSMYLTPTKARMPLAPGTTSDAPSLTAPPLARGKLAQR